MERDWNALRLSAKQLVLLTIGIGALVALLLYGSPSEGAVGTQTAMRAGNSGKCLAVYPGDFSNGAIAYQWTCGSQNNIEVEDAGGGWHYIKFLHSGKCLTVHGYAWWDGAILDQWDCLGQSNQKWSGTFSNGIFEIHASQAYPTKCMTVAGESMINGAWVNQWQCVYQSNQAWILEGVQTPTPTPTRTSTVTATPTITGTPTNTPTSTPTATATPP